MHNRMNRFISPGRVAIVFGAVLGLCSNAAIAATSIFVQNNSSVELKIDSIAVTGSSLSKKAWKGGEVVVAQGARERVLSINRVGKFNWMDPTPRFIEPGKTVVFSVTVQVENQQDTNPIMLQQKLLGTGSTSKMWYRVSGAESSFEWEFEPGLFEGQWQVNTNHAIRFSYRAYLDGDNTHVEYIFMEP